MTPSSNMSWRRTLADVGVVADHFGDDVARAFQRFVDVGDAFFGIDERRGKCLERHARRAADPRDTAASGSRPFSRAMVALVRRLGL